MICWLFAGICSTGGVARSSRVSSSCSAPPACDQRTTLICTTTGLSSAFMMVSASVRWLPVSSARIGEILKVLAPAGAAIAATSTSAGSVRILIRHGHRNRVGVAAGNCRLVGRVVRQLAKNLHGVGCRDTETRAEDRTRSAGAVTQDRGERDAGIQVVLQGVGAGTHETLRESVARGRARVERDREGCIFRALDADGRVAGLRAAARGVVR